MIITLYAESAKGRLRYYTIHDRQPSLESPHTLTAAWRTENAQERERRYTFESARDKNRMLRKLFLRTIRRGYRLLYSFDREGFGRFGTAADGPRSLEELAKEIEERARA